MAITSRRHRGDRDGLPPRIITTGEPDPRRGSSMSAALMAVGSPELHPVPWRRLGWVAWRRYRPLLVTTSGLLGLVAIFLVLRGLDIRHAYARVRDCTPAASSACGFAYAHFRETYGNVGPIGGMLVFVP